MGQTLSRGLTSGAMKRIVMEKGAEWPPPIRPMRRAESNPRSLKGDSGPIQRDSRFCPIFASEPRCFNFGIRPDSQFSRILAFSDRIPLRLPENTDIREWWSSWNQDDDVDGTGETTDF